MLEKQTVYTQIIRMFNNKLLHSCGWYRGRHLGEQMLDLGTPGRKRQAKKYRHGAGSKVLCWYGFFECAASTNSLKYTG